MRSFDRLRDLEPGIGEINASLRYVDGADIEAPLAREGQTGLIRHNGDTDLHSVVYGHVRGSTGRPEGNEDSLREAQTPPP